MGVRQLGVTLRGTISEPGEPTQVSRPFQFQPESIRAEPVLVSCIMPSRGHIFPARYAIECFQRQDYPKRELVVTCARPDSEIERYVGRLGDPRIRFFPSPADQTIGEMRNFAISKCEGDLISVWDDDDLSGPRRLSILFAALHATRTRATFLSRLILWSPAVSRMAVSERRLWEGTMLAERSALPGYESLDKGEDTNLALEMVKQVNVALVDHPASYCYVLHGRNVSGARHFAGMFSVATQNFEGDDYVDAIADLAVEMPIPEYAVAFFQQMRSRERPTPARRTAPPRPARASAKAKST
jgi:hypothetical protein